MQINEEAATIYSASTLSAVLEGLSLHVRCPHSAPLDTGIASRNGGTHPAESHTSTREGPDRSYSPDRSDCRALSHPPVRLELSGPRDAVGMEGMTQTRLTGAIITMTPRCSHSFRRSRSRKAAIAPLAPSLPFPRKAEVLILVKERSGDNSKGSDFQPNQLPPPPRTDGSHTSIKQRKMDTLGSSIKGQLNNRKIS